MAFKIPYIPSSELIIPEDSSLPKFCYADLKKEGELGRGSFGTTFKACYKGETVAVKELI